MPISSGFGYIQTNHPTPKRIAPPQIISRAPKFRENQRNKNQAGLFSNSKATVGSKLPEQRPTAVIKQPARSDTFTVPTKRDETNSKVPKTNHTQNSFRRPQAREPVSIKSPPPPPPPEQKRTLTMRKNTDIRPKLKLPESVIYQDDPQRQPVRFTNQYNNYPPSSSPPSPPPVYYRKSVPYTDPLPQDTGDRSRHMRIGNNEYVIHRKKKPPADVYTDYHTEDPHHTTRSRRAVQVVRDPPYRETDDLYYTDSEPKRVIHEQPRHRTSVIPKPPPPSIEYVYDDESPSSSPVPRHRNQPPRRSEVYYIDNNKPVNYQEEVVYVDDQGNEFEHMYDTEPINHRRNHKKSRQPPSSNIVYD